MFEELPTCFALTYERKPQVGFCDFSRQLIGWLADCNAAKIKPSFCHSFDIWVFVFIYFEERFKKVVKPVLPVKKRNIVVYVLDVFFSFVLPYQNLDEGATAVVLQFEFSPPNCLKIILLKSLKGSTLAIWKCHLLVDKEMSLWWNECCSATGTSVFHLPARLKWHHKVSWSHMCKCIIFLTVVWFWADCMFFWLLIHSHCPFPEHRSQISVFLPCLCRHSLSVMCSVLTHRGGTRSLESRGERGRREREAILCVFSCGDIYNAAVTQSLTKASSHRVSRVPRGPAAWKDKK